jgi:hypothetical protein
VVGSPRPGPPRAQHPTHQEQAPIARDSVSRRYGAAPTEFTSRQPEVGVVRSATERGNATLEWIVDEPQKGIKYEARIRYSDSSTRAPVASTGAVGVARTGTCPEQRLITDDAHRCCLLRAIR